MKFEWRKHEKALYGAKSIPALVDIPTQNFIMIKGSGNPNDTDFSDRVGALFSLAYAIKMGYKSTATKNILSNEIHDFTVYPLEGIWEQKNVDTESAAALLFSGIAGMVAVIGVHRRSSLYETGSIPVGVIIVTEAVLLAAGFAIGREYLASIRKLIGREQIRESMERVGLAPGSRKKVGKYSLGMRQRLGIAQAIMEKPSCLP